MTYKLVTPLKTRHVEPWADYIFSNKIFDKAQPALGAAAVRKAIECGWFEGETPNVDEMLPWEVVEVSTQVIEAFSASMKFDEKNSRGKPQTTPKK